MNVPWSARCTQCKTTSATVISRLRRLLCPPPATWFHASANQLNIIHPEKWTINRKRVYCLELSTLTRKHPLTLTITARNPQKAKSLCPKEWERVQLSTIRLVQRRVTTPVSIQIYIDLDLYHSKILGKPGIPSINIAILYFELLYTSQGERGQEGKNTSSLFYFKS